MSKQNPQRPASVNKPYEQTQGWGGLNSQNLKQKNLVRERLLDQRLQGHYGSPHFLDQGSKNSQEDVMKKPKVENFSSLNEDVNKQLEGTSFLKQEQKHVEAPKHYDSINDESTDFLIKQVVEQSKQEPKNSEILSKILSIQKIQESISKDIQEILQNLCQNINKESLKPQNYNLQNQHLKIQINLEKNRYRELQAKYNAYRREAEDKLKMCQQQKQQLQSKIKSQNLAIATLQQNTLKLNIKNKQDKQREVANFYSQLIISNNISSFLKESIQNFTKATLKRAKLIYQKDQWNTNISNYIERLPFNALILMKSNKGCIFGGFTEGIQTYVTNRLKEDKNFKPFRAFLFNATAKTIFAREEKGLQSKVKLCGVSYHDNYLRFGNNELSLKNNNLGQIVIAGYMFGEKYFNIQRRQLLTGQEGEMVELADLEIFELFIE